MDQLKELKNCNTTNSLVESPDKSNRLKTGLKSVAKDDCNIPLKKRRRSSGKRRSLFETLHSIPNTPVKCIPEESEQSNQSSCSNAVAIKTQYTDAVTETLSDDTSSRIDSIIDESVWEWYSSLVQESNEWKALRKEYVIAEEQAKQQILPYASEVSVTANDAESMSNNICCDIENDLENLRQRFAAAVETISACVKNASAVRITHETWLNRTKSKMLKFFQFNNSDPKVIIENIFNGSETLFKTPLSRQSIT